MRNLDDVVKAYDLRGTVPNQLDEALAHQVGAAFVHHFGARTITVGHDMRVSSPGLAAAFAAGANSRGADVLALGFVSTDLLYYASGQRDVPGAMITASHNPPAYNGIKLCRAGAAPVGQDTGLGDIRKLLERGLPPYDGTPGRTDTQDLLPAYSDYLHGLVPLGRIRRLKVVVDAGNGMAGRTVPVVLERPALEIVPLYFELDGTFPHRPPNPMDPANLAGLRAAVREHAADLGLAFDGDADRCFFVDETGEPVPPSSIVSLIADQVLADRPGATIVYNAITSRAVPERIAEQGGRSVRTRVGHSFIKKVMADTGAEFGGEHSGHYYFRRFWNADSGMLAALHVLAAVGRTDVPMSKLTAGLARYVASGELNLTVGDSGAALRMVEGRFVADGATADHLDGLTVSLPGRAWFNLRPSNTEPLLRLNVEAGDTATMVRLRDRVLAMLGQARPAR
ncbi:phosphomannomutase/phosphoglucomutase [Kribbella shirazensis]|uniref:Phosphomannomutase n=1 Tax=Kribbella shirazensis TaxID=1105143 RepID=A0A7X5VHH2_9ACTN|nr:phosphomannomutase/phosphoglucomutase [Kribbella shirazensis]NIK61314.1 phosphomannomutase [Kribbella shirazensis]